MANAVSCFCIQLFTKHMPQALRKGAGMDEGALQGRPRRQPRVCGFSRRKAPHQVHPGGKGKEEGIFYYFYTTATKA